MGGSPNGICVFRRGPLQPEPDLTTLHNGHLAMRVVPTALKFPVFCDLVSGFLRLVTVWLHVGRGGVTGSDGP